MRRVCLEEVDSTNKWSKEHLDELFDMSLVYTYRQTAGRGRLNRSWNYIGEGNIYASIVLKPNTLMCGVYSNLTQYLSLVLSEVFEEYGTESTIKWPNDVRIGGKKISGILAEGVNEGKYLRGLILGFGVNLNCKAEDMEKIDQPATSLNLVTGMEIDKESFLNRVTDKFCLGYDRFIKEGFTSIREEYKRRTEFLGEDISVRVFDKIITGRVEDITESGGLKIVGNDMREQTLLIGDIL